MRCLSHFANLIILEVLINYYRLRISCYVILLILPASFSLGSQNLLMQLQKETEKLT
jgi:hypothetical protein